MLSFFSKGLVRCFWIGSKASGALVDGYVTYIGEVNHLLTDALLRFFTLSQEFHVC